MTPGLGILRLAVAQSLRFYSDAPLRGQAWVDHELALRIACQYINSGHKTAVNDGLTWFDHCFAELQRCGYAVAPDKERTK